MKGIDNMKIINKREGGYMAFSNVHVGDVFVWCGEYYIVIPHILDCDTDSYYNVFSLSNNVLGHFEYDTQVLKVNAEIVIT